MEQLTEWREGLANWLINFFQGFGSGLADLFGVVARDPVSIAIWLGSIVIAVLMMVIFLSLYSRYQDDKRSDEPGPDSEIEDLPRDYSNDPSPDTEVLYYERP